MAKKIFSNLLYKQNFLLLKKYFVNLKVRISLNAKLVVRGGVSLDYFDNQVAGIKKLVNFVSPIKNARVGKIYYYRSSYRHLKARNQKLNICLNIFSELRGWGGFFLFVQELLKIQMLLLEIRKELDLFSPGVFSIKIINNIVVIRVLNLHLLKQYLSYMDMNKFFNQVYVCKIITGSTEEASLVSEFFNTIFKSGDEKAPV